MFPRGAQSLVRCRSTSSKLRGRNLGFARERQASPPHGRFARTLSRDREPRTQHFHSSKDFYVIDNAGVLVSRRSQIEIISSRLDPGTIVWLTGNSYVFI